MENKSQQRTALFQAIGFAWQFGYTIVVPLLIFGLGGRWLDRHYGTGPWLFLAGVLLSIAISSVALVKKAMDIMKTLDQAGRKESTSKPETTPPPTPPHDNIPRR
jgi:F0F1-type ATP synthase assembly protein I